MRFQRSFQQLPRPAGLLLPLHEHKIVIRIVFDPHK